MKVILLKYNVLFGIVQKRLEFGIEENRINNKSLVVNSIGNNKSFGLVINV